jgi:hypothetical protein
MIIASPQNRYRRRGKFPGNREICEIFARCPAKSRTNTRQMRNPGAARRELLPRRKELFSLGREFNPVIGNLPKLALILWSSQEI